ncbi:MAG: DUF6635 family protein [Janthinobacterium lividum]
MADGLAQYFAERRARVAPFVDRHFTLRGSAGLHRAALGWDLARAPANLLMSVPQVGVRVAAGVARRVGAPGVAARLGATQLQMRTDVAREIEWLVTTELLELPASQPGRASATDALGAAILAQPGVGGPLARMLAAIGQRGEDPAFRARLEETLGEYGGTRAAAAEIATGLLTLGTGALAVGKLTPGVAVLGPSLAAILAQQAAVAAFPLGSALGGVYYGLFPAVATPALVAEITAALALALTLFAAFSGVLTDPLQRRLGLHRRRLGRMLAALERQTSDPAAPAYAVRDHYAARLIDLFGLLNAAARLIR